MYDAFREAGVSEGKSTEAAKAVCGLLYIIPRLIDECTTIFLQNQEDLNACEFPTSLEEPSRKRPDLKDIKTNVEYLHAKIPWSKKE